MPLKQGGDIYSGFDYPVTITAPGALSYTAKLEMLNAPDETYNPGSFEPSEGLVGEDGIINPIYHAGNASGLIIRATFTGYGMGSQTAKVEKEFTLE